MIGCRKTLREKSTWQKLLLDNLLNSVVAPVDY